MIHEFQVATSLLSPITNLTPLKRLNSWHQTLLPSLGQQQTIEHAILYFDTTSLTLVSLSV